MKKHHNNRLRNTLALMLVCMAVLAFFIVSVSFGSSLNASSSSDSPETSEPVLTEAEHSDTSSGSDSTSTGSTEDGASDTDLEGEPSEGTPDEAITDPAQSEDSQGRDENPEEDQELDTLDLQLLDSTMQLRSQLRGSSVDDDPVHRKYVEPNGNGSFSLSLEVTGDQQTVEYPADVVVIFDVSASTSASMLNSFKLAARSLADILLTPANSALPEAQQVRMSIVTFSETAKTHGAFTSNRTTFENSINQINSHAGEIKTNWTNAISLANTLLLETKTLRPTSRPYTLFLTDGGPTDKNPNYYGYVEAEARATVLLSNGVTLYTLGVLDNNNQGMVIMPYVRLNAGQGASFQSSDFSLSAKSGYDLVTNALTIRAYQFASRGTEAAGKYFIIHKESDQNYIDAFKEIAKDIIHQRDYTQIKVTDVLSDYVTLLNPVDGSGNVQGYSLVKIKGGVTTALSGHSVTYNHLTRSLVLSINADLEHEATYRLTVTLVPSQKAFDELANNRKNGLNSTRNGYPHVGGTNTGTNSTGLPGFYSNSQATLTYHTKDGEGTVGPEETAAPFEQPVIQLSLGSITVQKNWVGDAEAGRPGYVDVVLLQDGAAYKTVRLTKTNSWYGVFDNIPSGPSGHVYTLQELSVGQYSVSYAPTSAVHSGLTAKNSSFVVTNTKSLTELSFRKISSLYYEEGLPVNDPLQGATFELYSWALDMEPIEGLLVTDEYIEVGIWELAGTATSGPDGMVVFSLEPLASGCYQLVETQAPANHHLPAGQWRIPIDSQGQLDTNNIIKIQGEDGTTPPHMQIMSEGSFVGELALVNIPDYELPLMGGGGIWFYLLVGINLILLAVLYYLFIRAKREVKKLQR